MSQALQTAVPLAAAYVPGPHAVQNVLFAAASVPGGHTAQSVWLPPAEAVPGAHTLHAVPLLTLPGAQLYCAAAQCSSSSATRPASERRRRVSPTLCACAWRTPRLVRNGCERARTLK